MHIGIWADGTIPDSLRTTLEQDRESTFTTREQLSPYRRPRLMAAIHFLGRIADHGATWAAAAETWFSDRTSRIGETALAMFRAGSGKSGRIAAISIGVVLLVVAWIVYAIAQFAIALVRTLAVPMRPAADLAAALDSHHAMQLPIDEQIRRAGCDVWLVADGSFPYPPGVKAVSSIDDVAAKLWAARVHPINSSLPKVLRQVARDPAPVDPLPKLVTARPAASSTPHLHLFLPATYRGGTWDAARNLAAALVEVNRRRRQITVSLGVPDDQPLTGLDMPADELAVERIRWREIDGRLVPFSPSLLRASAWFALADQFAAPLLPARNYALVLHDVIHRRVPESYPRDFHARLLPALRETVRQASLVIATTEATRRDIIETFAIPDNRVAFVPVACEPRRRFAGVTPKSAPIAGPFLLNPTNAAPHKGAEVMLEGYALLRRSRPECPPLVLCGNDTERLSPTSRRPTATYWSRVRRLVTRLGLRVGEDVYFLGYVDDAELMGLLQSAAVVINSARHDNGTYALIEAHELGKPTVSSRYPAAVELYQRFRVPVTYFELESASSLAEALGRSLDRPMVAPRKLGDANDWPAELSLRRFAERVYDHLVRLASAPVGPSSPAAP
jgi:glycosyltransferase involved in cell wall biosynthesis